MFYVSHNLHISNLWRVAQVYYNRGKVCLHDTDAQLDRG